MAEKILGGKFKNQPVKTLIRGVTHPLVRSLLFEDCKHEVKGADFLDLFAGSGIVGLEALSLGARSATFVDHCPRATQCITTNLDRTHMESRSHVRHETVQTFLSQLHIPYDLIFADVTEERNVERLPFDEVLSLGGTLYIQSHLESLKLPHLHRLKGERCANSFIHKYIHKM